MKVRLSRRFDKLQNTDRIQTAYVKIEDLDGTLDGLMKKAMLYKHRDDEDGIEEMERLYNSTVQEAERRQLAMQGQGV
jgi:anaphase-promoting complex subunit 5